MTRVSKLPTKFEGGKIVVVTNSMSALRLGRVRTRRRRGGIEWIGRRNASKAIAFYEHDPAGRFHTARVRSGHPSRSDPANRATSANGIKRRTRRGKVRCRKHISGRLTYLRRCLRLRCLSRLRTERGGRRAFTPTAPRRGIPSPGPGNKSRHAGLHYRVEPGGRCNAVPNLPHGVFR